MTSPGKRAVNFQGSQQQENFPLWREIKTTNGKRIPVISTLASGYAGEVWEIGIDEDTAVVVESDGTFHALGSGAVYVVDGHDLSYTNISEVSFNRAMSVFG